MTPYEHMKFLGIATIDDALKHIPKYVYIEPESSPYIDGDEYFDHSHTLSGNLPRWKKILPEHYGKSNGWFVVRRPIPQNVRQHLAIDLLGQIQSFDPSYFDRPSSDFVTNIIINIRRELKIMGVL